MELYDLVCLNLIYFMRRKWFVNMYHNKVLKKDWNINIVRDTHKLRKFFYANLRKLLSSYRCSICFSFNRFWYKFNFLNLSKYIFNGISVSRAKVVGDVSWIYFNFKNIILQRKRSTTYGYYKYKMALRSWNETMS